MRVKESESEREGEREVEGNMPAGQLSGHIIFSWADIALAQAGYINSTPCSDCQLSSIYLKTVVSLLQHRSAVRMLTVDS